MQLYGFIIQEHHAAWVAARKGIVARRSMEGIRGLVMGQERWCILFRIHFIITVGHILHLSQFTIVLRLTRSHFIHEIVFRCVALSEVEKADVLVL